MDSERTSSGEDNAGGAGGPGRSPAPTRALARDLGLGGAALLGVGAMLGSGIFVGISPAAAAAGPAVVVAVVLAALLALVNALGSAQLAAAHPVAGGAYEYGHRFATPALGWTAGALFLLAKSASAATAALALSGYAIELEVVPQEVGTVGVAAAVVVAVVVLVLAGLRRSAAANAAIVLFVGLVLAAFVVSAIPAAAQLREEHFIPFFAAPEGGGPGGAAGLLRATALIFVAYTGYGRIATLGEEVREPRWTIPRAILLGLGLIAFTYVAVVWVAIGAAGAGALAGAGGEQIAPLAVIARETGGDTLRWVVGAGAAVALVGVLLNLVLGLSRVALAMGRRGDLPAVFARVDAAGRAPVAAVLLVGALIGGLACLGSPGLTWSFSAFTVLVYYGINNACALRLPPEHRLYPRWVAVVGLAVCFALAFWVDWRVWVAGIVTVALTHVWRTAWRAFAARRSG